jgi:hypothetical protein
VTRVMVRYTVRPEHVAENVRLVEAVYAEMAGAVPDGFRYSTYRLDDGLTFVHLAVYDGVFPLAGLAAWTAFRDGLDDRCVAPPERSELAVVGSHDGPQR